MENKIITFNVMCELCKFKEESGECVDVDNITGTCDENECPYWNDLCNADIEV